MASADQNFPSSDGKQKLAYSIKEVQQLVGVGRTSIFKAIKEQKLRIAKCGSRSLVLSSDLQEWLASLPRQRG
jgi:excisionase family DNA binding protein